MSNPISVLPPEGVFVSVTANDLVVRAAFWNGHWRDVLADGGWMVFPAGATWEHEIPAPVNSQPAPVATQTAPVSEQVAPVIEQPAPVVTQAE